MTEITTKYSERIRESYTLIKHKSGLRAYIIPKDFSTTYCVVGIRGGGLDNEFIRDEKLHKFPFGMAHFLEHKLFANPDGEDTFEKFAETGAYCNAYTSFDKTAYLFSMTGDITRSLEILLESFTSPYFTKENVENEASIISEEIKMYMDDAYDALFYAMVREMYNNPNIAQSVCGSVESVNSITPEMLYDYYNAFYCPANTVLCIAGHCDTQEVVKLLDRFFPDSCNNALPPKKPTLTESPFVNSEFVFLERNLPIPIFNIGIKITPKVVDDIRLRIKHDIICNIICEEYFSESDVFVSSFFENGDISHLLKFSYDTAQNISLITLCAETEDPVSIANKIKDHILEIPKKPLTDDKLKVLKQVVYSHYLQTFDSTSDTSNEFLAYALDGFDLLDLPEIIDSIDISSVNAVIKDSFIKEKICVAIAAQNKEDI